MAFSSDTLVDCPGRGPDSRRRACARELAVAAIVLAGAISAAPADAQEDACAAWSARLIEAAGPVELQRSTLSGWTPANVDDRLCENDSVRVGAYGRAAVLLPDDTVFRLDQFSTITFVPPEDDRRTWVELVRGIMHIISRAPRALHVTTPFLNAGIEGTEFRVEVTESRTSVDVLEGAVTLTNPSGAVTIEADQTASGDTASIGRPQTMADPYATLDWTRYYALVIDGALPAADAAVAPTPGALAARAQSRLRVGRVAEAEDDLTQALAISPDDPDALAVRAIILLARAETGEAQRVLDQVATESVALAPLIARAQLAQQRIDLETAAGLLRQATEAYPESTLAWSRLAEINLSLGDLAGGLAAAERAETLSPGNAQSHVVRGFAALDAGDTIGAETEFRAAMRIEPSAPLGRLGLGLALIRSGALADGRAEIENAVLLDAGNGLVRSYVAKAYYDERRAELAASQLEAAKRLDPQSPTPYLYDALRKQNANDPVDAFRDLLTAAELNRNQPAFRSGLRMDNDLGARSAGRGRIYRDLGFETLALREGWVSVTEDPMEFAGHQLLADTYSLLPRHQIARVNELYQAQLLQPANAAPTPPQLGEANLFLLNTSGPADLAHTEFDPMLIRGGLRLQGSGITGGNETRGETIAIAGVGKRLDYNVGQFHYETDGFRPNNDFEQDLLSAFVQYRPSERTSLQAELRSNSIDKGDLLLRFDPTQYDPVLRGVEDADTLRLGIRTVLSSRSLLIGSLAFQTAELMSSTGDAFRLDVGVDDVTGQIQHIYRGQRWSLTSGVSISTQDLDQLASIAFPIPDPPFIFEQQDRLVADLSFKSIYSYATVRLSETFTLTAGIALDSLVGQSLEQDKANPKLGFSWNVGSNTTVRAAAFSTLNGPVISKQIIQPSLEPTHVTGFNQFYFGPEGDEAEHIGLAIDHRFSDFVHTGAEISRRDVETPLFVVTPMSGPTLVRQPIDESMLRAYLYWAPHPRMSIGVTYEGERFDNHGEALAEEFTELETSRLPITMNYFSPSGFRTGLTATPVHQRGSFWSRTLPPGAPPIPGEDAFWVFDLSVGYRLPNRRGLIEITARNLFDEEFQFQDTDPETPRIFPERFVGLRFTLAY